MTKDEASGSQSEDDPFWPCKRTRLTPRAFQMRTSREMANEDFDGRPSRFCERTRFKNLKVAKMIKDKVEDVSPASRFKRTRDKHLKAAKVIKEEVQDVGPASPLEKTRVKNLKTAKEIKEKLEDVSPASPVERTMSENLKVIKEEVKDVSPKSPIERTRGKNLKAGKVIKEELQNVSPASPVERTRGENLKAARVIKEEVKDVSPASPIERTRGKNLKAAKVIKEEVKEVSPASPIERTRGEKLKASKVIKEEVEDVNPTSPILASSPGDEDHLSESSRLYLDTLSILNGEGCPMTSQLLKNYISPVDVLITKNKIKSMPTLESIHEAAAQKFVESFKYLGEMDKRMSHMIQSLALGQERELKLEAELKASNAKVAEQEAKLVEYESTIRHLQRSLETVCSTHQAALACVDKEVKVAKAVIEAVGAELAAKQDNSATYRVDAAERMHEQVQKNLRPKCRRI